MGTEFQTSRTSRTLATLTKNKRADRLSLQEISTVGFDCLKEENFVKENKKILDWQEA